MLFRKETRPLALEELYSKADQLPAFTLLQAFRYCTQCSQQLTSCQPSTCSRHLGTALLYIVYTTADQLPAFTLLKAFTTTLYLHRLMTRSAWLGWKQTVTCLVAEKPVI
jgi:hypothetical protein